MIKSIYNNFKRYWFLITQLISRDFKVKYKRSVLGILWSLLNPLLTMTVMTIVFSQMFKVRVSDTNYIVYLMTGIIMFNYFSGATTSAMSSVVENFTLINKIYIPKYIFPIAKCLFVGIDFILTLIPWFIIILLTQFGLGKYPCSINIYYLLLPVIFACFFLFTVGVGFFVSCISVFLRDVFHIYGIVLTLWNYLTPIFYGMEMLPSALRTLMKFNPLYQFINAARSIVLYGTPPNLLHFLIMALIGLITFFIGGYIFRKKQDKFIYYV